LRKNAEERRVCEKTTAFDESVITRSVSAAFVEIVSKGAFRFTPDGSFEGQASQIRIHHRDSTRSSETRKLNQKETDQGRSGSSISEDLQGKDSSSDEEKEVK